MADMTYARYLDLDRLLGAQAPLSGEHDEMLFVVIHQTKELWLKQILHELDLAQVMIRSGDITPAYKSLARVSRIQAIMTASWDVLTTMTPADYMNFREHLGPSSGFQSDQFRALEFRLGLKDPKFLEFHRERPHALARLQSALDAPSLYDDTLHRMAAAGLAIPEGVLNRDVREPWVPNEAVEAAWAEVYSDTRRWWELYQLAEKLVDLDDALLTWRFRHVVTVERVIGGKRGTGGSAGVSYLASTLQRRAFPELWTVRTRL